MISGSFVTIDENQTYNVSIGTGLNHTITDPTEQNFDPSEMVIMFDTTPVIISCDRQDLLKRIIISQATINLVTNQDLSDYLFAETNRSIPVTISLNNNTCFFGYIDPLQYDQGYAHVWENVQINATDELGALENIFVDDSYFLNKFYIKDGGIVKPKQCRCLDIIEYILNKIGVTTITTSGSNAGTSYSFVHPTVLSALNNTKFNMAVFFGESPDDYKNTYEVLEMICKYFNLYIAAYAPHTVVMTSTINNQLVGNTNIAVLGMLNLATDGSTSLSTDDAYSQVALTCNIEPEQDIVISFDNDDYMYSNYDDQVRYMTEYVSNGDGFDSWNAFYNMINGNSTDYRDCYTKDHFMYVLRNDLWDFGSGVNKNYIEYMGGSINYSTGAITPMTESDQTKLLTWLAQAPCKAALVGFSSAGKSYPSGYTQDNSVNNSLNMDKYLVISTMGTWSNNVSAADNYQSTLYNAQPICKYRGLSSNILSPTDENVTNFIVISGSLLFNPLTWLTGPYWNDDAHRITNDWLSCKNAFTLNDSFPVYRNCWRHSVNINDSWSYYNQYWYGGTNGVYGFLDNSSSKTLQYNYSANGDDSDKITKLPVLCCQLKVGSGDNAKYCCEHLELGEAGINKFEWLTASEASSLGIPTTFTIGIDPKHDDYIIGQKYQLAQTANFNLKIDKSGMAIPITYDDNLNGDIEFSILGPYNAIWTIITRIHPSFWRHTRWEQESRSILDMCQSIMLSNLKIEMTSNNGGIIKDKTSADNDLVYYSDEITAYTEKLEDDNDICTALTLDECERWGIKFQNSNSYIFNASTDTSIDGTPFRGFPVGNDTYIKPEECYVDYMFKEYCKSGLTFRPARIIQTQLKPNAFINGLLGFEMNLDMLTNYFTGLYSLGDCRLMSYEADLKNKTIDARFRQHRTVTNDQI